MPLAARARSKRWNICKNCRQLSALAMRLMKFRLNMLTSASHQESGKKWNMFLSKNSFFKQERVSLCCPWCGKTTQLWYCTSVSWSLLYVQVSNKKIRSVCTGTWGCWSDETTKRSVAWRGDCHNGKNGRAPPASINLRMLKMFTWWVWRLYIFFLSTYA